MHEARQVGTHEIVIPDAPDQDRNKLSWTEGHNWQSYIESKKLDEVFEYKYAIQESATQFVKKWEGGFNRKVSVLALQLYFDNPEIAAEIRKSDEYKFTYQNMKMVYLSQKLQLRVLDCWQS